MVNEYDMGSGWRSVLREYRVTQLVELEPTQVDNELVRCGACCGVILYTFQGLRVTQQQCAACACVLRTCY